MKLKKELEEKIKAECTKFLKKGRSTWDLPHTLNAVRWARKIIENEGGDEKILVPAMYFHDTGYPELKEGYSFEEVIASKKNHAKRGAANARKVLKKVGGFNDKEISEIVYLVANHDKHHNVVEYNRKVVMDADSLSMLDFKVVPPNLNKKDYSKFINRYFLEERSSDRWHTKTGRKNLKKLFREACDKFGVKAKI